MGVRLSDLGGAAQAAFHRFQPQRLCPKQNAHENHDRLRNPAGTIYQACLFYFIFNEKTLEP